MISAKGCLNYQKKKTKESLTTTTIVATKATNAETMKNENEDIGESDDDKHKDKNKEMDKVIKQLCIWPVNLVSHLQKDPPTSP